MDMHTYMRSNARVFNMHTHRYIHRYASTFTHTAHTHVYPYIHINLHKAFLFNSLQALFASL